MIFFVVESPRPDPVGLVLNMKSKILVLLKVGARRDGKDARTSPYEPGDQRAPKKAAPPSSTIRVGRLRPQECTHEDYARGRGHGQGKGP